MEIVLNPHRITSNYKLFYNYIEIVKSSNTELYFIVT